MLFRDNFHISFGSIKSFVGTLLLGGVFVYVGSNFLWSSSKLIKFLRFWKLSRVEIIAPSSYPAYVENSTTVKNIERQICSGPGVIVFWGPPDSGKSSYAIRTCNALLKCGKIGGLVGINDKAFSDDIAWLNNAMGQKIMQENDKFSSVIPRENASYFERFFAFLLRRNKRVVILFDQFDNLLDHATKHSLLKFVKRLAEDSVKYDAYSVLLCVTNPTLAREILDVNGGKKIKSLQHPLDLKWGQDEILKYFGSSSPNDGVL